ncbi:MAG: DUF302 domain-containing protein [Hyphomicrobium sp.]
MKYYMSKTVTMTYDDALVAATDALKSEGFGVLTEIDVSATLKTKLGVEFPKYKILGACNPPLALKALTAENQVGVLLPCNVVVQQHADGRVEVSAMDPVGAMSIIGNATLTEIATEVKGRLDRVLAKLT